MDTYQYLAFISYRHISPDQQIAARIRRYLENMHLPASCPIPKKRKAFRDTDELPTSTDLGADIEKALENSGYLIAVCSEEYVTSRWCMREIEKYLEMGRKERILVVLVSGTPESSIPENIRDLPICLDLRNTAEREIRSRASRLLSAMSGTDEEEIAFSDRKHRILTGTGIFAAAAAVLLGAAVWLNQTAASIDQNNRNIAEATQEAVLAEEAALQERDAAYLQEASFLSRKSWIAMEQGNAVDAVRLAREALPADLKGDLPVSEEAVNALRMALVMPERQKNNYYYLKTIDFDIPAYDFSYYRYVNVLGENADNKTLLQLLPQEPGEEILLVDFSLDDITAEKEYYLDIALEGGYQHMYHWGSSSAICYYGEGAPLYIKGFPEEYHYKYQGELFYPIQTWIDPNARYIAGWDGECLVLFSTNSENAVFSVPAEQEPQQVVWSEDGKQMAVLEADGELSLFYTENGTQTASLDGPWRFVAYPSESYRICAVPQEGAPVVMNAATLEEITVLDAPASVIMLQYCSARNCYLALCEGCAALLDGDDGELLSRIPLEDMPGKAMWEGNMSGNRFGLIYENRIDIYALETADSSYSVCSSPLYSEKQYGFCYNAFYSADSRYVYLEDRAGNLFKWDADTGKLCWINESHWVWSVARRVPCFLNRNGTGIWRQTDDALGIEKIDEETGELLYSTDWGEMIDGAEIRESADGRFGLVLGMYYEQPMMLFNGENGKLIAMLEPMGNGAFSEDGEELLLLCAEDEEGFSYEERYWDVFDSQLEDSEAYDGRGAEEVADEMAEKGLQLIYRRIAASTGAIMEERELMRLESGQKGKIRVDEDALTAWVDNNLAVDLSTGDFLQMSEEPETEPAYLFAGEEVYLQGDEENLQMVTAEGTLVVHAGAKKISVSPDGESFVLYASGFTPLLIHALDADTLVREAERKLSEQEP